VLAADSVQGPPAGYGENFANSQAKPMPIYVLGANIVAPPPTIALTNSYAANLRAGSTVQGIDPNFRTAYASQWNLSLYSAASASTTRLSWIIWDRAAMIFQIFPIHRGAGHCEPLLRSRHETVSTIWPCALRPELCNSSYEALVAKYEHRVTSGLNFRIEYAFAKAPTDSWQSSLAIQQISGCRACSKGPAAFDVRNRAVSSLVWNLPFGRSQRFGATIPGWANMAAGGWLLSAITTFASGQPVIMSAPNQTRCPVINPLPDRVCDGRDSQLSNNIRNDGTLWFDTAYFSIPAVG
jgi:hypothetical protein